MAYRRKNQNLSVPAGEAGTATKHDSMQEIFDYVSTHAELSATARRDICSALRTIARAAARPLSDIPADVRSVRDLMATISPARHSISAPRWTNVRSLLFKALKHAGVPARAPKSTTKPSARWHELLAPLPERQYQIPIRPFARWCTERGIEPGQVTQADFEAYGTELEEKGTRARPRGVYCALVRTWNRAQSVAPTWPDLRVEIDSRRDYYARPLQDFTAEFQADIQAMVDDALGRDPFSSNTRRPVRPVTAEARVKLIRAFASALIDRGWSVSEIRSIADIVTIEAAKAGLKYILDRKDGQVTLHTFQHAKLLCTLAKHWVKVPEDHLAELARMRSRLRPQQQGMTAKNRATLRQFDDDRVVDRFLSLPEQIWREYATTDPLKQSAAVKLQLALAIALLTDAPVRCGNLHSIRIGTHLVDVGSGRARRVHLSFPADEVKNGVELEFPLSDVTRRLLDRYLHDIRPKLLRAPSDYLFPGQGAGPKRPSLLSGQIADTVEEKIGVRLTAHQFRHLIGYIYLQTNPGQHEVVRQLLGHKDIQTTLQFYAGMETQRAIAHYDAFLDDRRSGAVRTPARKRPRRRQ